ncbi:PadR family transcriptional regulator [Amycolatopsis sp. cmx-11-12]|uniref:PadR family transcriptional regulator n=1 Tax=Amycolatopsis sp. cmx-11-12 TaxID=2785795 RepID=UPI0039170EFA
MPLDASRNSLVLPLLGLLVEQPSHAYDLTARLRERYGHLPVTRSTVTSLLKTLERTGMVASRVPERVGNRPPRTTFELTETGMADFRRKIETGLREGQVASVDFIMAVAYAGALPADHARSILDTRADRLDRELATLQEHPDGVAEVHMLEVAYWRTIIATEIDWIRKLASRIRSHDIDWPGTRPDGQRRTEA